MACYQFTVGLPLLCQSRSLLFSFPFLNSAWLVIINKSNVDKQWLTNWLMIFMSFLGVSSRMDTDQDCGRLEVQLPVSQSIGRSSNQSHHRRPEWAGSSPPTRFRPCWNYKRLASRRRTLRGGERWKKKRSSKLFYCSTTRGIHSTGSEENPFLISTHRSPSHPIHQRSRPCCHTPGGTRCSGHCDTQSLWLRDNWPARQRLKHTHRRKPQRRFEGHAIMKDLIFF